MSSPDPSLVRALASRYVIERALGHGGMADVYLANDVRHQRPVAIKVVRADVAAALGRERFLREIEIAARLRHPHILPLFDSGEADGHLFYVMPYAEGETLRDRMVREGRLPIEEARRIAREIAGALGHAHDQGVVHRDIKPENVLFESGQAVVADFGIARAFNQAGGARITTVGVSIGTPSYMSPEQAIGDEIDARSDIYALGCVLFEMLAGRPPYVGPTAQGVMQQHLTADIPDVREFAPEVDASTAAAIASALQKEREARVGTAREFAEMLTESAAPPPLPAPKTRRTPVLITLGVVLALSALGATKPVRALWARTMIMPEIEERAAAGDWERAHQLAKRVRPTLTADPALEAVSEIFLGRIQVEGEPAGARVFRRKHATPDSEWELLGTAPLVAIVPRRPHASELRIEADGFETTTDVVAPADGNATFRYRLLRPGERPAGMVLVLGGVGATGIAQIDPDARAAIGDFFLDSVEVTNLAYQEFVDAGGYTDRRYWTDPFREGARVLSWDEGIARMVDRTGRPGPATWVAGRFPRGEEHHPVAGVSWYEARAYASFRGKRLPDVFEWATAARFLAAGSILPGSNIGPRASGTLPVGSRTVTAASGVLDIAGNVREWCLNESRTTGTRYLLGGGWDDPEYRFYEGGRVAPMDRSASNGIRLALSVDPQAPRGASEQPVEPLFRDYTVERPVSDEVFAIYRRQFAYDPAPLDVREEAADTTERWIRQRVSFTAARGGDRVPAFVYLPRKGKAPYQTVVFFPGSNTLTWRSYDQLNTSLFDFLIDDGRAVILPIYLGTFERDIGLRFSDPEATHAHRDRVVRWQQEVSRTLDFIATRPDLDSSKVAFQGFSWGGRFGSIVLAIEPRFKAGILMVAGLNFRRPQPEVDDLHYLPRVKTPVLMLNGRYDTTFPLTTAAEPMYRYLGTPAEDKRHVVLEGQHYVPLNDLIRESLAWLEKYLGPVR